MINVYCRDRGWLFQDLQALFRKAGAVTSEEPLPYADAWICIRTDEWKKCPDPRRLVLQIHDMWEHDWPTQKIGALVRSHPNQRELDASYTMTRPLGALRCMQPMSMPLVRADLTLGWVGRPANLNGLTVKSPQPLHWAVSNIRKHKLLPDTADIRVMLVGTQLQMFADSLERVPGVQVDVFDRSVFGVETYPSLYAQMDIHVITSTIDAGPVTLFESLACGIKTLSTPVGWAGSMLDGKNGWIYRDPLALWTHIENVTRFEKDGLLDTREEIAFRMPWRLDGPGGWIEENMHLAGLLV